MSKKTIVYVDALNLFYGAIKPSRQFLRSLAAEVSLARYWRVAD